MAFSSPSMLVQYPLANPSPLMKYPEVSHFLCSACPDVFHDFISYKCHMMQRHPPDMRCPRCQFKMCLRDFDMMHKLMMTYPGRPLFVYCRVCRVPFGNFKEAAEDLGPIRTFCPAFYQFYVDPEQNVGPMAEKSEQYAGFIADRFTAAMENLKKACEGTPPRALVEKKYWSLLKDSKELWLGLLVNTV